MESLPVISFLNRTDVATNDDWKYGTYMYVPGSDVEGYYAVKLSDAEYATVSVNLKQPFLSAIPSGTVIAKGDKVYIRGTAEGDPSKLQLYIFGPNKFVYDSITVEEDGSYEKKIEIGSDWSSNQYYVVIEHPMYNNKIDVHVDDSQNPTELFIYNAGDDSSKQSSFTVAGSGKLQGSNAADALTKMIDSPNIDDIYTKLTFTVAEPWIRIINPGDQAVGTKFTISGTTNLAVDDQILVEVTSSSFSAVDKTSTGSTSGVSQTTKVAAAGDGAENTWSVEIDTTNWNLDEYTVKVSDIEVDISSSTIFNIVEKLPDTPTPTATGATPTTTATATATPATPGFGAFVALAGLGAVALLVLRRN
ncbi:MAG: PGF-CTERM sorting domain-containing protein [Methanocalculaceae archaeon]|jgi:PGF-CTERM protein|nr:PGF-CTERM sorting domain-containing protein [Methanocalculaceae archaeon]